MFSIFCGPAADDSIEPDARTHRISVVIAAILRCAHSKLPADCEEGTLAQTLGTLAEEPYEAAEGSEEYKLVCADTINPWRI